MPSIVLVHGTTQTADGFNGLISALSDRGHRAVAVRIPSGTDRTAAAHADVLAGQVPADFESPVVVAHSAGGLLLPALASAVGAAHQVWLAAVVPDYAGKRSFRGEVRQDPAAVFNPDWMGVDPSTDPELATHFLFHDADPDAARAALPTVQVCDIFSVYEEVPTHDPAALPSSYLLPTDDRTLLRSWMTRAARERLGVEPVPFPGGHNPYVGAPERVADLILSSIAG